MGNDKNITEGKNGKLYYGKGTKGGMATQPTTPNSDITKINIASNVIKKVSQLGSLNRENGNYTAYNNAYTLTKVGQFYPEAELQEAERQFNLLKEGLSRLGCTGGYNPLLELELPENSSAKNPTTLNFLINSPKRSLRLPLFNIHLKNGKVHNLYNGDTAVSAFYEATQDITPTGKENTNNVFTVADTLSIIEKGIKTIADEITRQGYEADNQYIATLIGISVKRSRKPRQIPGDIKEWIPIVYSDEFTTELASDESTAELMREIKSHNEWGYPKDPRPKTSDFWG